MIDNSSYPVFKGSLVAMITPMTPTGDIDREAFKRLIDWHVEEGSDALIIVGTSGESPTIDFQEHVELVKLAVEHSDGRIPIIAGTGGNSTKEAIFLANHAKQSGATAGLSVVPYYNKPTQEGLYQHYKAISENSDLPIILYNVPGRTVIDMKNDTVLRLAELQNIIGIKDATGDLSRITELVSHKPEYFQIYSGDDPTAAALILMGAQANITVTGNIAPKLMHELCFAALEWDITKVREISSKLDHLNHLLFMEPNPIPIKYAVHKIGKSQLGYRLPLTPISEGLASKIDLALKNLNLI
ncbi:4-hydroxy-tetrahydrodipicolinate synthase [Taylorella equigenitalis]|nr:4-hydroxy-tetrahydrodipicolinate synthase [Taylorella equigenitalis]AFN36233.1 dihydrodipicolinate synthase [Taylorella equigenitalis ATCC 35865]ASY30804.1 4-hydroxy-tetrahydrodipicolinate synthase [Taylorella equigenitalis]ASY39632.1 4-hydroxy-tetrahydrodipicolinate synthase [Taylorella equigenitalis]ASY41084.1 4-hydroxy-tetrahydrodipicolinate synthase [Taylorella equigenitalis]KOS59422.1 dihydrodipicolinate synthase [Taylorella equigenitalis]